MQRWWTYSYIQDKSTNKFAQSYNYRITLIKKEKTLSPFRNWIFLICKSPSPKVALCQAATVPSAQYEITSLILSQCEDRYHFYSVDKNRYFKAENVMKRNDRVERFQGFFFNWRSIAFSIMNWLDNSEIVKLYRRLRCTYVPHGQFQPNLEQHFLWWRGSSSFKWRTMYSTKGR